MAKKRTPESDDNQRQSRKEVLIARRQARQTRQIRLAILAVILLIAVVIIAGVVNAAVVKPNQLVAIVANQEIKVSEWRDRVELQRAQLILSIEDLAESLGQDIGQVQQFAGQQLLLLTQDSERLGQIVLDQMIDEVLIQQAAEARGIFVSDEDVQKEIEESFSYFGGASPTALPTATETVIPTPSLTPIPTAVITEIVPTRTPFPTPTLGPTSTPFPTSTPVSQESFDEQLLDVVNRFEDLGISEEQFRNIVRSQLYQERLLERLAVEEELSEEAMHASLFYLEAASEDAANNLLEDINEEGFLEVWNAAKSEPFDPEAEDPIEANEILWRTQENIGLILDEEVANVAFEQPLDSVSRVIVVPAGSEDEEDRYFLIMVSGREVRPLTETALSTARQELLESFLQVLRASEVETFERWRNNLPAGPTIDSRFLVAPTPTPFIPEEITPDAPEGEGE